MFSGQSVHAKLHFSERSFPQLLSKYIRAQFRTVSMLIIMVVASISLTVIPGLSWLFLFSFCLGRVGVLYLQIVVGR
jgi:hypothetical protein